MPGFRPSTPPEPRTLNPPLAQTGGFASASLDNRDLHPPVAEDALANLLLPSSRQPDPDACCFVRTQSRPDREHIAGEIQIHVSLFHPWKQTGHTVSAIRLLHVDPGRRRSLKPLTPRHALFGPREPPVTPSRRRTSVGDPFTAPGNSHRTICRPRSLPGHRGTRAGFPRAARTLTRRAEPFRKCRHKQKHGQGHNADHQKTISPQPEIPARQPFHNTPFRSASSACAVTRK